VWFSATLATLTAMLRKRLLVCVDRSGSAQRRIHSCGEIADDLVFVAARTAVVRATSCSTDCATITNMASRTVRARLDPASERALSALMSEGRNESEAVRTALIEAGKRRSRRSALAVEVERLAADAVDTAERKAVMADIEAIAADWPE
jgi:hypothetical protein